MVKQRCFATPQAGGTGDRSARIALTGGALRESAQMILAIDPGIAGAYALLGDTVLVDDLPIHQTQHGKSAKVRAELDLHSFRQLLTNHAVSHCFIERVTARPGQGVTSMFRFGQAAGALYGLIVGLGLPVTFATPQEWQRHHHIGAAPDAARQRAVQAFPDLAALFFPQARS